MKVKKLLLSFVLAVSMLFVVSCKDKTKEPSENPPAQKTEPTVSVEVADRVYDVGEKLEDIELMISAGSTSGTVSWDDENYTLLEGNNDCIWNFTPTDSETYNSKTGNKVILAYNRATPVVVASLVDEQTIYVGAKLSSLQLQASATCGQDEVLGTIAWKNPNAELESGENECEWIFKPTSNTQYKEVSGTITLNATEEQYAQSIAVIANSKTNYVAFDTLDKSSLSLCLIYNAGKVEEISDMQYVTVKYNNNNTSLRRGDTKVEITYRGQFTADVTGISVDYKEIVVPEFTGIVVYNGTERTLTLQEDDNYTFEAIKATDAGVYNIEVTLADAANYKWSNGDFGSTNVECRINQADVETSEIDYEGEYDGAGHSAQVTNDLEKTIYFSETQLNSTNYSGASTSAIEKINAGIYTIYYYIPESKNYHEKSGSVLISISKQTPTIKLQECYTLVTNDFVNYPTSYISIIDKADGKVDTTNFEFTYYTSYSNDNNSSNDTKTSSAQGATNVGGAPKNSRATEYYVVVEFLGNENFEAVSGVVPLYIDGSGFEFSASGSENKFAFKNDAYTAKDESEDYALSGSNAECNGYLEFIELEKNSDGLKVVRFKSKFFEGEESKKDGRLIYDNGYKLLCDDGTRFDFSYVASGTEITEITIAESDDVLETTLSKWEMPLYLKTFTAQTVSDADYDEVGNNGTKNTEITIYNDYGTIRFSAKINVAYIDGTKPTGGYQEWAGVVEPGFNRYGENAVNPLYYDLVCYVTNEAGLESTGYPTVQQKNTYFTLNWLVVEDGNVNPNEVFIMCHKALLTGEPYNVLLYNDSTLSPVFSVKQDEE